MIYSTRLMYIAANYISAVLSLILFKIVKRNQTIIFSWRHWLMWSHRVLLDSSLLDQVVTCGAIYLVILYLRMPESGPSMSSVYCDLTVW